MTTINNAASQPTIQTVQPKKEVLLKKEEQPIETKKGISTTTKVVIGTGLAALAAVGMYVATKGKSNSLKAVKVATTGNLAELPSNIFKAKGNYFVKGKAVLKNGEPYTGEIVDTLKNGDKVVRTYENGLLKKAVKTNPNGAVISNKEYDYLYREFSREPRHFTERRLKSVKQNGDTLYEVTKFTDDCFSQPKKIIRGDKRIYVDRDFLGKPQQIRVITDISPVEKQAQVLTRGAGGSLEKGNFVIRKGEHAYFDQF